MSREWTGSVAVLPDSMDALAVAMANLASASLVELDHPRGQPPNESHVRAIQRIGRLEAFLRDEAYSLSEWAAAVRELYARLDEGEGVTNAQGVAMARLLRGGKSIHVMRDVFWAPTSHLGFTLTYEDGREIIGGIEPDGTVNT